MCLEMYCSVCGAPYGAFGAAVAKHAMCQQRGMVPDHACNGDLKGRREREKAIDLTRPKNYFAPLNRFHVVAGTVHFPFEPITKPLKDGFEGRQALCMNNT